MGLAASQSRLLSMTSRMSDLELRAQMLSNQKVALATASSQASNKYIQALNGEHLSVYSPEGEYTDATADLLTSHDAMTGADQLFLQDESGNVLCSEDVLRAFNASNGNLETFLNRFGCTSNPDSVSTIKNVSTLLSNGLMSISNTSEDIRMSNILNDANSGINLNTIKDKFDIAQLSLDTLYSEGAPVAQPKYSGTDVYDSNRNPILTYLRNDDGSLILDDETGYPSIDFINSKYAQYDTDGNIMRDDNGYPVLNYSDIYYDKWGQPIIEHETDEDGNIVKDENGIPVIKYEMKDGKPVYNTAADGSAITMVDPDAIKYLELTDSAPSAYLNSIKNIANTLLSVSCECLKDENGDYITDKYGLYQIAPKYENGNKVYTDEDETIPELNIYNEMIYAYAQRAAKILTSKTLSTNKYYYSNEGITEKVLKYMGIDTTQQVYQLKPDGTYEVDENGENILVNIKDQLQFNASGADLLSNMENSDVYRFTKAASSVLLEYYKERGLSEAELQGVINATDVASVACMSEMINDTQDYDCPTWLWDQSSLATYKAEIYIDENSTNKNLTAKDFQGKKVANASDKHKTSYASMINKFMAYFDAVISDQLKVKSSYVQGSAVSGVGDFNFDSFLYIANIAEEAQGVVFTYNELKHIDTTGKSGLELANINEINKNIDALNAKNKLSAPSGAGFTEGDTEDNGTEKKSATQRYYSTYYQYIGGYYSWGWHGSYYRRHVDVHYQTNTYDVNVIKHNVMSAVSTATIGQSGVIPTLSQEIMEKFKEYLGDSTSKIITIEERLANANIQQLEPYEPKYQSISEPTTKKRIIYRQPWEAYGSNFIQKPSGRMYDLTNEAGEYLFSQSNTDGILNWVHYDNEEDAGTWNETQDDNGNIAYTLSEDGTGKVLKRQMTNDDGSLKFDINEEELEAARIAAKAASDQAAADALTAKEKAQRAAASASSALGDYNSRTSEREDAESALTEAQAEQASASAASASANDEKTAAETDLSAKEGVKSAASTALTEAQNEKTAASDNLTAKRKHLSDAKSSLSAAKEEQSSANSALDAANAVLAATDPDDTEAYNAAKEAVEQAEERVRQANERVELEEQNVSNAEDDVSAAETRLETAESNLSAKQQIYDDADAAVTAAQLRYNEASTIAGTASDRLNTANTAVTSATTALADAVSRENTAKSNYETKQSEADTAASDYTTAQSLADTKLAEFLGLDPEDFRNVPVWEYAVMEHILRPAMDDYLRYTYIDENGEQQTTDLRAHLQYDDEGNIIYTELEDFPEIYQSIEMTDGETIREIALTEETAEQYKNILKDSGYEEMDFFKTSDNGEFVPKDCLEILQMYNEFYNKLEDEKVIKRENEIARMNDVIKDISSINITTESVKGFEDYSKHFAKLYKQDLQKALNDVNYNGLEKYITDILNTGTEQVDKLRKQLYGIEDTVKTFLRDAGKFFDTTYVYTKEDAAEVQAIKNMATQKSFTNEDLLTIKEHISNILKNHKIDDTIEIRYSSESSVAYYKNIFDALKASDKPVGIDEEKWNDSEWLKNQLKVGNIHVSVAEDGELKKKQYNTAFTYLSTDTLSDAELTKAQADYEAEVARISKKEKKIDRELQMIETEHNALEQEVNSIKTNKDENIQRNFQLFS